MKIRKDDKVIVIAGKDKGNQGKVLKAMPKTNKVVVEGVNIVKKHIKSSGQERVGKIVEKAMPIDVSNVALIDPKTKKATRVRVEKKDGKLIRIATKSGSQIK